MALVLTDGFETYWAASQILTKWTTATGISLGTTARTGARSATSSSGSLVKTLDVGDQHATMVAGLAIRTFTGAAMDVIRFLGDAGATEHIVIRRTTSGEIAIDRGATQVAISGVVLPNDTTWRFVEAKVTLDDTAGQVDVYLNGSVTPTVSFTGDTRNAGTNATIDQVTFGMATSGGNVFGDDYYIVTAAGSAPTDLLGEVRCWPIAPSGDGNYSQLVGSDGNSVSNYLLVDEAFNAASATDYVGSATDGQKDTYAYGNLTPTTGTVISVEVASATLKSDGGTKSFRPVIRSGGADYTGTDIALALAIDRSTEVFEVNPATSAAWTIADVNAAEFGFEVRP